MLTLPALPFADDDALLDISLGSTSTLRAVILTSPAAASAGGVGADPSIVQHGQIALQIEGDWCPRFP
jgi:hypothetical protein